MSSALSGSRLNLSPCLTAGVLAGESGPELGLLCCDVLCSIAAGERGHYVLDGWMPGAMDAGGTGWAECLDVLCCVVLCCDVL